MHLRLRQPGGRGQPQRRAHGRAAGRACRSKCPAPPSTACAARAWTRSARPRAPSRPARPTLMIAGGVESMSRAPFVMPKAESAFCAHQRGLRHHHRLALRQQADEGAVRRRLHARDGGERRHRLQDRARGAGPHGAGLAAEGRGGAEGRLLRCRDHAGDHRRRRRATRSSSTRDEHPRETSLEALARLKGVVRPDGTRDRRQCQRRQRRRLRAAAGRRGHGREERPDAARARRRHGHGRRARRA